MMFNLTATVCIVQTIILLALLYVYGKNLKKARSSFTIGLFVFTVLFIIQNIISLYFYFTMMEYYAPQVEIQALFVELLQTVAFAVLLKITYE